MKALSTIKFLETFFANILTLMIILVQKNKILLSSFNCSQQGFGTSVHSL